VVAAPPYALNRFIAQQAGTTDRTAGQGLVFLVADWNRVLAISQALQGAAQFRRIGPITAALVGQPVQAPLIQAYALNTLNGPPLPVIGFNSMF
jgi:hypothetical protein